MPITTTTTVYTFAELSPEAQRHAIQKERDSLMVLGNAWAVENQASFDAVIEALGQHCDVMPKVKLLFSTFHVTNDPCMETEGNWDDYNPSQLRVWKWAQSNWAKAVAKAKACELTQYAADASIVEPIAEWMRNPGTLSREALSGSDLIRDLFQRVADAYDAYCEADWAYQLDEETIREGLDTDEHLYLENGSHA